MRGLFIMMVLIGSLMAGGCTTYQTARTVTRLQGDVEQLRQRVSLLEGDEFAGRSMNPLTQSLADMPSIAAEESAAGATVVYDAESGAWEKPSLTQIQEALTQAGFYQGPIDGKMGRQTREAIRQFQQVHGLQIDGRVGRQTWAKLLPYLEPGAEPASSDAAISLK